MNAGIDFESLAAHGEPIAGQTVPRRFTVCDKVGGNRRRERHNGIFYDRERAEVCLNCPLPSCAGSQRCYKRMKQDKANAMRVYSEQLQINRRTTDSVYERMNMGESLETFFRVLDAMLSRIEKL